MAVVFQGRTHSIKSCIRVIGSILTFRQGQKFSIFLHNQAVATMAARNITRKIMFTNTSITTSTSTRMARATTTMITKKRRRKRKMRSHSIRTFLKSKRRSRVQTLFWRIRGSASSSASQTLKYNKKLQN